MTIELEKDTFYPGDFLTCEYFVKILPVHDIQAVETSVIWITEGKGEEDIGVHFFERRQKRSLSSETFDRNQRASTVLPASPLSYEGEILKIRWCVRVRLFLGSGEQITEDRYFRLGNVIAFDGSQTKEDTDEQSGSQGAVA